MQLAHYGKGENSMQEKKVPLCEKYTLSINEAAEYFRIGQKRLRRLVAEIGRASCRERV